MDPRDDDDTFQKNDNIYKHEVSLESVGNPKEPIERIEVNDKEDPPKKEATAAERPLKKVKQPIKPKTKRAQPAPAAKKPQRTAARRPAKRPNRRKQKSKGSSAWPYVALVIVILAAIGVAIYVNLNTLGNDDVTDTDTTPVAGVAATVNGETISLAELDKKYNSLPDTVTATYTKDDLLDQLINETLLIQRAKEMGFTVSDEEAQQQLDDLLAQNGITQEQFQASIVSQGLTLDDFIQVQKNRLLISQLFDATIFKDVEITDAEVEAYYADHLDDFVVPNQVKVRHILIMENDTLSLDDAEQLAQDLKAEIEDGADFCDLVQQYSQDAGSVDNCGEYTFPRGVMDSAFEEASFDMAVGDIEVVQTSYGYHVIEKLEDIPEQTLPLEDVTDDIKQLIMAEKGDENFAVLMDNLRAEAHITYGDENPDQPTAAEQAAADDTEPDADADAGDTTGNAVADITEPEEATAEDMVPITEPETDLPSTTDLSAAEVASCLASKDAVMYGVFWSKNVQDQKDILGDAFDQVTYVECDPNGPDAQPKTCTEEGIEVYPTWIVGDNMASGVQELGDLASLADC